MECNPDIGYYVSLYYPTEDAVKKLSEVHAWWNEAVEKGQDDLKDKPWWPKLNTLQDLIHICSIIIWWIDQQSSEGLFENNYKKDRGPCGPNSDRDIVKACFWWTLPRTKGQSKLDW